MMSEKPTAEKGNPSGSLRSDEPIRSLEDDRLSRDRLVGVIASHILATDAPESVVIALNAPWGAGKSSFLNLLEGCLNVEYKEGEQTSQPIIIRFNPWHYGSVEQLARMFFAELGRGIGTAGLKKLGKKIGNLLNAAGSIVSVFSSGAGSMLKDAGKALKDDKGLSELKAQLDKLLPELNQRVVVFIDDIDRLERDVLRLLFRMVRLNADFPNIIYVLAFDRIVVERNLDEENGIRGRDYLEKIIQVSFDIPEPEPETIHHILFAEMDAVLASIKTRPLDQHRWGNVFHSGFKEHFRTIRHIKRYANGLRLTLAPVAKEVDLVDFLAIELIRVFHPEVYLGIVQGKDMLVPERHGLRDGMPAERLHEWTEALSAKASPGFQDSIRQILRELFPELARAYENTTYSHDYYATWRKNCRVCSSDVFDKFFLLAIPTGDISEVEIAAFVKELADAGKTAETVRRALDAGKARRLLERLEDFTSELPAEHVKPLVKVMFDLGDELRFKSRGMFDISADWQIPRIIYQIIRRLESEDGRYDLLLKSVQEGTSLYTAVQEASLSEPKAEESEGRLISDHERWTGLRDAALARIRAANESGELWNLDHLPYVLFRWLEWTTKDEVHAAVDAHVTEGDKLIAFLGRFVSEPHSHTMGDKVSRVHRKINKQGLEALLDLGAATARLKEVSSAGGEGGTAADELIRLIEANNDPWDR